MEEAKRKAVFVGLPKEKVGGEIYGKNGEGNPRTIIENAAVHEYGSMDGRIPERSMLRVPFKLKKAEIGGMIIQQWQAIAEGNRTVDVGMGRIGIAAVNIIKQAFATGGFGTWKELSPETVAAKGHGKILEDTRVMRNSMTWVVRND